MFVLFLWTKFHFEINSYLFSALLFDKHCCFTMWVEISDWLEEQVKKVIKFVESWLFVDRKKSWSWTSTSSVSRLWIKMFLTDDKLMVSWIFPWFVLKLQCTFWIGLKYHSYFSSTKRALNCMKTVSLSVIFVYQIKSNKYSHLQHYFTFDPWYS